MRKSQRHHKPPILDEGPPLSESEFSFTSARLAVAQICQTVGFKAAQNSALEALTDITTRYLLALAKAAAASANSHGRTESNLTDIIVALEELASVRGFVGSSNLRSHSLYTSAVVQDLILFVKHRDETPFAQPLPRGIPTVFACGEGEVKGYSDGERWRHVPRWLPHVPEIEGDKGDERVKEKKWGCLDGGIDIQEENSEVFERFSVENGGHNRDIEVVDKRGKLRFKIGVGFGGDQMGMIRNLRFGGGIGKRVLCNGKDENESTNLMAKKKPR